MLFYLCYEQTDMSDLSQGMVFVVVILVTLGLVYYLDPFPDNDNKQLQANAGGVPTTNPILSGRNVAKLINDSHAQPKLNKAVNTTNWFLKDKKYFTEGMEKIYTNPRFVAAYNLGIQQLITGVPDDSLLSDLQGPRNPTITGRFNQSSVGVREAGIVTKTGIDISHVTPRWRDPTDSVTSISTFNKKQH